MKKLVIILFVLISIAINVSYAGNIHAIIFAATSDETAGDGSRVSFDVMKKEINYIQEYTSLRLETHYYTGNRFSRSSVEYAINNLRCGSDDVILFYYIGHGFRYRGQTDNYPTLAFVQDYNRDEVISFDWIARQLKNKGARLTIAIADACNNETTLDYSDYSNPIKGHTALSMNRRDRQRYKELFENSRGHVTISSSEPGQFSWISPDDGGYFTQAFVEVLKEYTGLSGKAEWKALFSQVRRRTQKIAQINDKGDQNPQSDISVSGASQISYNDNWMHSNNTDAHYNTNNYNSTYVVAKCTFYSNNSQIYFVMSDGSVLLVDGWGNKVQIGYTTATVLPQSFVWSIRDYYNSVWEVDYNGTIWYWQPNGYGGGQWFVHGVAYTY